MVIQLDHQTRKNMVLKHIQDNDCTGFNQLCSGLEKNPKTSMSRNTIAKIRDELIDDGTIAIKFSVETYGLSAKIQDVRFERKNLKKFDRKILKFETKLKKLSNLFARGNLYSVDKVTLLRRFAKSFWFVDFELYTLDETSTEKQRKMRTHRLEKLKKNFLKLAWNDSKNKEVYKMLLGDLKNDSNNYEMDFDAELEDWESNPED